MAETNFLLFQMAGRVLALPAACTRQVVPMEKLYALPGARGALLGLIPAAGRALPVVDLPGLAGFEAQEAALALICEIGGETLALPAEQVIGFVSDEAPGGTELLSAEVLLGGYFGGGHKAQVIEPGALLREVSGRMVAL